MKDFLKEIVKTPAKEARWLNTLSLLEFIGAQKISKTVCQSHPSLTILEHQADESRHAFVFKKLGLSLSKDPDYLCRDEAVEYFQTLDHQLSDWITQTTGEQNIYQNYLIVTCLIERRAMKLYPLYRSMTSHDLIRDELQKIILEEANHREIIEAKVRETLHHHQLNNLADCEEIEEGLFGEFGSSLQRAASTS